MEFREVHSMHVTYRGVMHADWIEVIREKRARSDDFRIQRRERDGSRLLRKTSGIVPYYHLK